MMSIPIVLKAQTNQTVNAGSQTAVVNFPVTTCLYNWVNNNPAIGLAASGIGDIAAFTAINNTGSTINATITATPTGPSPQPPLLYIPNFDAGTVSVINATTNALITTITVGANPYNVMVSHDYNRIYVANQGSNNVSVIYMPTNRVLATIPGFSSVGAMAVSPDNLLTYVLNTASNTVSVISNITYTVVSTIPVGVHPIGLALSTNGSKLYVTNNNGTISIINTADLSVTTTGPIVSNLTYIVLSPDINSSKLYVADLVFNKIDVISTATNTVMNSIPISSRPNVIAVSPDGSRLYVASSASNNVSVINTATNTIMTNIFVGSAPTGLSVSEDGSLLYVTNSGSNTVSVINTALLSVATTFNVGAKPFAVGNFYLTRADCSTPITFNITVNSNGPAVPAVITTIGTPSAVSTIYGTPSSSSSFMVSGTNMTAGILVTSPAGFEVSTNDVNFSNTVTIPGSGAIASTRVYIRLKGTTAAGTHLGNIVLSSPGATDVPVTMPNSTVSQLAVNINIYANINYGDVLNDMTLIPSNFDFSTINASLKNGETANAIDVTLTGGNTGRDPVGVYNNVIHSSNLRGNNGFLLSNYTINYNSGPITIARAPLIITASNVNKPAGNTLTGGAGSTAFTVTGLQNGETINSVTITYGNGSAANAPAGPYNGSVVPSAALGGNGYLASNYAITYIAGNIVVAAAVPAITTSGTLQPLTTVYGTPSSPTSFTVSGSNLTAGIFVTPPAGFEVSADNVTFSNAITVGSAGTVTTIPVYIRLKQTTFVGSYQGNIALTSAGATAASQIVPTSTVTPAPLLLTANDITKIYGNILTAGTGSTAFVAMGLKNAETVGSITVAYGTGAAAGANAGTYAGSVIPSVVTGGTFTAGNYTVTYQAGNITVTPAPLTVTADNKSKIYGDANPILSITYAGFVNGDSAAQLTTQPIITTTATQTSVVGQYPITISDATSTNYTITYINAVLTVVPAGITIPNAFTPNGDGINDTWNIINLNSYPKVTVEIMNRYGNRVYFSIGYSAAWDGNHNNVPVPFGVYYYIIKGVSNAPLSGYITVLR
jgi:gliding motility-associated-like protein